MMVPNSCYLTKYNILPYGILLELHIAITHDLHYTFT